jgi:hypothetical protein
MLRIQEPFHGAILSYRNGRVANGALHITVSGDCPPYGAVTVNGVPATLSNGRFSATVPLTGHENLIAAAYDGSYGHLEHAVRVVWDRNSFPRYRFSIDDNSFFLRDVARKQYDSLFDCFYLDILRTLNREYGAKFTLNIYFETDDGFQITDFPDRYRAEWESCADWLGLAFHAYANLPDRPYQYASADKLMSDLRLVEEQIVRFAGPQTLIPPTVIHWGMVLPEALPALYEHGVRVLSGFLHPSTHGYDVHYWQDDVKSEHVVAHGRLKEFDSGIVFSLCNIIINNTPLEQVAPTLEPCLNDPWKSEIIDLFTHEQYFWDFWPAFVPDHAQRLDAAIRWCTEHGYKPVFFHEGFLGAPV